MTKCLVLAALVARLPLAHAATVIAAVRDDGLELARYVIVENDISAERPRAQSRTVYLNKNGVTLTPGPNDSRANRSSLVSSSVTIPPWQASPTLWSETVSCLRVLFARFDIQITDSEPGNVPHIEAVFGGGPALLEMGPRVAGVSPFSTSCLPIENAIVFTFTDVIPDDAQVACEIMAQEIAHSYGLDHELLANDPMTYLPFEGERSFQDELAECGESSPRACGLPGYPACRQKQNSVAMLLERVGRAGQGDRIPPLVSITSPVAGASVVAGFQVVADISDNVAIRLATASLDGVVVDTLTTTPWIFETLPTAPSGSYRLTVKATDGANEQSHTINVLVDGADPADPGGGALPGCATAPKGASALLAFAVALATWLKAPRRAGRASSL